MKDEDELEPYLPCDGTPFAWCTRCGAIVQGDVGGQTFHDVWHRTLARDIAHAGRNAGFLDRIG